MDGYKNTGFDSDKYKILEYIDIQNTDIYIYIYIYIYMYIYIYIENRILSPVKPELGVIPSGQEIIRE